MTDHKFTDDEVIKALERCIACNERQIASCNGCSLECFYPYCDNELEIMCLDLINRQKAEIDRLREKQEEDDKLLNDRVIESVNAVSQAHLKYENALEERIKTVKAEAIKEFAERLKKTATSICSGHGMSSDVVYVGYINGLVKEMTEAKNE